MPPSRRMFPLFFCALLLCLLVTPVRGASFQVFAVVYGQVTNDIALIESHFDNSSAQKQKLARLVTSRNVVLHPTLSDEQALTRLVAVLGPEADYAALLDQAANNARSTLLDRFAAAGERIDLLPPSVRTTRARTRYQSLGNDLAALNNAQHAGGIAAQLAPFSRSLDAVDALIERAVVMPRPNVRVNSVHAIVNGHRFTSNGSGGASPNLFEVEAPSTLYRDVQCRVVDRERVITFTLPVLTEQSRYEIEDGLAALVYTPDIFEVGAVPVQAVTGTFWVQTVKGEIYGIFSCSCPGVEIKEGKFRIKVPKDQR